MYWTQNARLTFQCATYWAISSFITYLNITVEEHYIITLLYNNTYLLYIPWACNATYRGGLHTFFALPVSVLVCFPIRCDYSHIWLRFNLIKVYIRLIFGPFYVTTSLFRPFLYTRILPKVDLKHGTHLANVEFIIPFREMWHTIMGSWIWSLQSYHYVWSNEETFLQDFLVILKRNLQNYFKILK